MKTLYLLFILTVIVASGCNDQKNNRNGDLPEETVFQMDTSLVATTDSGNKDETFIPRYLFENGNTYSYKFSTLTESEQQLITDTTISSKYRQIATYIVDFKIDNIEEDSTFEMKVTVKDIKIDIESAADTINYIVGTKEDSAKMVQFSEFEAIRKNPFSIRLSKQGEVLEVFRADKIASDYTDLNNLSDSLTAEQKSKIREDIANGFLRPIMSQIFRVLPNKKLATDSVWIQEQKPVPILIFQMNYSNVFTVKGIEMLEGDRVAVFNGSMKTTFTGDTVYSNQGINYNFQKPVTTAKGSVYFNLDRGLIQKSITETNLHMQYTMQMPNPQTGGTSSGKKIENVKNVNVVELMN